MEKIKFVNVIMVLLCVIGICINYFFEEFRAFGAVCIAFIGILGVFKERFYKKK